MSHKFKALVRLSEDLEVVFSVDGATYAEYGKDMKNYFDSYFGVKIEPEVLGNSIKLESVKRTSDGSIAYPIKKMRIRNGLVSTFCHLQKKTVL